MAPGAARPDAHGGAARLMPRWTAVVLALLVLASGGPARAAPAPLGACGPVDRADDVIELPVARLRGLRGTPVATVGVVGFRDGVAAPIPFQLDESTGKKIVLTEGPEARTDDSPGVLDDQDLLVFMACDAGEAADAEHLDRYLAGAAPVTAWREVKIDDPLTGRTAFVYVIVAPQPPHTDRHYVEYDSALDMVVTARYRLGCVGALPVYLGLALDGPLGPNVLDGLRLRAEATLVAGLAHWTLNERQGRNSLIAWKSGPVRVVRRSRHEVEIGLGIHLTAGVAHTYFYAQHIFGPGAMKLPFSPSVFFRDITAMGGADFRDLRGWRFRAPGVPGGDFLVDGKPDPAETAYATPGDWLLLHHEHAGLLVAATVSPNFTQFVRLEPLFVDDATRRAPPEDEFGSLPLAGFRLPGIQRLQGGRYRFQLNVAMLPGYRDGDEQRVLKRIATPLTADVTDRGAPAAAPAAAR